MFLLRVLAILLCILLPAHAADTVLRLSNGEWPPYFSETMRHYGAGSRIVSEAFASEGVRVGYGFFPWNRSLLLAEQGVWDGTLLWLRNEERERNFYLSEPVIDSGYVLFYRVGERFDWQSLSDLKPYRIGGTLGYDYGATFTAAERSGELRVERAGSDEVNFRKLLAGHIDIFPMDKTVGYYMLHLHFPAVEVARLTHHGKPLRADPLYLLLSKKNPANRELMQRFNRGLRKLQASGKVERYLQESRQGLYDAGK